MTQFLDGLSDKINSQQLIQYSQEIQDQFKLLKAFNYRCTILSKQTFRLIKQNTRNQEKERMLKRIFFNWKKYILTRKIMRNTVKKVLRQLQKNQKYIGQHRKLYYQKQSADNFRQKYIKKTHFINWLRQTQLHAKIQQIKKQIILKNAINKFFGAVKLKISIRNADNILDSIHNHYIQKSYFNYWKLSNKYNKVIQHRQKSQLPRLIDQIKCRINKDKQKCIHINNKLIYKKYFFILKANMKINKSQRHYQKNLLSKSFKIWNLKIDELFYEKQSQKKTEYILEQYLKRKERILCLYYFQKWKKNNEETREGKNKLNIARQFYSLKEKHYLLQKYFYILKEMKKMNRANNFRKLKLSEKAYESFRLNCLKQAMKFQNLCQFVENREKKKYFDSIKIFNKNESLKVNNFRQRKILNAFTLSIIRQYIKMKKIAEQYHQKSLLYKSFFTIKKQTELAKKTMKTIIYLHTNMYLKRWYLIYRIKQFKQSQKYVTLQKIFLQLKLLKYIGKNSSQKSVHSKRNIVSELKSISGKALRYSRWQHQTENESYAEKSTFEFEKLIVDSPQKMFSLDYSCSAYNSNQNPAY